MAELGQYPQPQRQLVIADHGETTAPSSVSPPERQLVQGTTLYLPVVDEGALFSCGDAHAAQGDGEVCVTGIETPIGATLRFILEKGRRIPAPQFRTSGPLTPWANRGERYGTTGVGPDLTPRRRTPYAR